MQEIKKLLGLYGFKSKKRLGQNFLIDERIAKDIVDKAGFGSYDVVVEIGPGTGILTKFLARSVDEIIAVETDRRLCEILSNQLQEFSNIEIIHKDFLKFHIKDIAKRYNRKIKIFGNLPFYVTSPIILYCLSQKDSIESLIFGIQKEVAGRLLAKPGQKDYGSITCYVRYLADINMLYKIPKSAFWPQPKVDAAVIRMDIKATPSVFVNDEKLFFKLIRASFNQRRKTLLNSLQRAGFKKDELEFILKKIGIEPAKRGETLTLEEFASVANALVDTLT